MAVVLSRRSNISNLLLLRAAFPLCETTSSLLNPLVSASPGETSRGMSTASSLFQLFPSTQSSGTSWPNELVTTIPHASSASCPDSPRIARNRLWEPTKKRGSQAHFLRKSSPYSPFSSLHRSISTATSTPTRLKVLSRRLNAARRSSYSSATAEEASNGAAGDGGRRGAPLAVDGEEDRIEPVELHEEMSQSFVAYAMSVIVGRALPDARDGLKPVHRRILYAMRELGLGSNKPFRKCARVVGEVLGKFHPHGDTAVYDALVRMAQDFSLRSPLIAGHGNFGSVDADPPAAMRYTECKLQQLSEKLLLEDIDGDTVDFVPNFDGSTVEPSVLPAKIPHLLINGSQGIAVGMATNIPPHNLGEVVDALICFIHHPQATVQQLMEHIQGPDFPTGGSIVGRTGIEDAYLSGKGSLVVRGKTSVEEVGDKGGRSAIIITELPYQTNKAVFVEKLAQLVNSKSIDGISDLRDESDRSGMRVVVELKRQATPLAVLGQMLKLTALQSRFSCNFVGLVNGEPREMNLKDFFQVFLDFRTSVVVRRAKAQLAKTQEREHYVQGLLVALDKVDAVVEILRSSPSSAEASRKLRESLELSEVQADAILGMPLRRLTTMEVEKLKKEHKSLLAAEADLKHLIGSKTRVLQVIEAEALAIKEEFATPRRTRIEAEGDTGPTVDPTEIGVPNETVIINLSEKGYLKRMSPTSFRATRRGTTGKSGGKLKEDDVMCQVAVCGAHDSVLFFSDKGTCYKVKAYQINDARRTAMGQPVSQLLPLSRDERVTSMLPVASFENTDVSLVMLTRNGFIKKTSLDAFAVARKSGLIAIQLEEGDELKWVRPARDSDSIVIGSRGGYVVRFLCDESQLRNLGRNARGVRAMSLKEGDEVAAMDIIPAPQDGLEEGNLELLVVSEGGIGKRVPVSAFEAHKRPSRGVIGMKLSQGDSLVALHMLGVPRESGRESWSESGSESEGEEEEGKGEEVLIGTANGVINRIRLSEVKPMSRAAKGVTLMKMGEGDGVRSVSLI